MFNKIIYDDLNILKVMKEKFSKDGFVKLGNLLDDDFLDLLRMEIKLCKNLMISKKIIMPPFDTARQLQVIGGDIIEKNIESVVDLYNDNKLISILSYIANEPVLKINHSKEKFVINSLVSQGDVHGWHVDDPKFAFVIILETANKDFGGNLKYISNWQDKLNSEYGINTPEVKVEKYIKAEWINTANFLRGDCYLLNAKDNLHMVSPLKKGFDSERLVLNLAYHNSKEIVYGGTADKLYSA